MTVSNLQAGFVRPEGGASAVGYGDRDLVTPEEAIQELEKAVKLAEFDLSSLENNERTCLASRVAWALLYDAWQRRDPQPKRLVSRLERGLRRAEKAVAGATNCFSGDDRDRLGKYVKSISFRAKMLDLLVRKGPAAVEEAYDRRLAAAAEH